MRYLLIVFVVTSLGSEGLAQSRVKSTPSELFRNDPSNGSNDRLDAFLSQLDAAEAEAIRIIGDSKSPSERSLNFIDACQFVGRLRSIKAVPMLCDRLVDLAAGESKDMDRRYPAAAALRNIGYPGIYGLLDKVASADQIGQSEEFHKAYFFWAAQVYLSVAGKSESALRTIDDFPKADDSGEESKRRRRLGLFRKYLEDHLRKYHKQTTGSESRQ